MLKKSRLSLFFLVFFLCGPTNSLCWQQVNIDGFGDSGNLDPFSMVVYKGYLHAGTTNETSGGEVWQYDGSNWTQVNNDGFGDPNNEKM